jgi:hypothetical protein
LNAVWKKLLRPLIVIPYSAQAGFSATIAISVRKMRCKHNQKAGMAIHPGF